MTRSQVKRGMMVCVPLDADVKALQAISCTPGVVGMVGRIHHTCDPSYISADSSVLVEFPGAPITDEWYVPLTELRTINEENE